MISLTEGHGELKEAEEIEEAVGEQQSVIRLANSRDCPTFNFHSKGGVLGSGKLLFSKDLVMIRRINSTLFQASFITNWSHQFPIPVNESFSASKSVVDEQEGVAISASVVEEVSDEHLSQDDIKG